MSAMGLNESYYQALHDQWGEPVANVVTLALIVGISALGVRRELVQRI
jgi:hypothetical protein